MSHAEIKEPEVINEALIRACLTTADYLPIPNEKIEEMKREAEFHEIVALSFSFKNILKIDNLHGLHALVKLSLDNNIIEKIEGLSHLVNLQWLDLSFNNISVIDGLQTLTNLEDLSLSNNKIEKLEKLDTLDKLNLLSIGNNQLKSLEDVLYLRRFRNLKMLSLAGNPLAKDAEYNAYVISHLSFSDWQSGAHLSYLDYRLVDTSAVATAREQFQDKIMELGDKEKEEAEAMHKQKEIELHVNEMRQLGLERMDKLIDDFFEKDAEREHLNLLPFWNEIKEDIKGEYGKLLEHVVSNREPLVRKKAEERDMFNRAMEESRQRSIDQSLALINRYAKRMKKLSASVEREELDAADAATELARARMELNQVCEELSELQLRQQEVEDKLIGSFKGRYEAYAKEVVSDTVQLFERLREKVQAKYSEAVAGALQRVDDVSGAPQPSDADDDPDKPGGSGAARRSASSGALLSGGGAGGEGFATGGDAPTTEEQAAFLRDKEAVLHTLSASRDALTAALDAREGQLVAREKEEAEALVAGAERESGARDRQRTTETLALRRDYDKTIRALEAYYNG